MSEPICDEHGDVYDVDVNPGPVLAACDELARQTEPAPRRTRAPRCAEDKHTDRLIRANKRAKYPQAVCTTCGDHFPCRTACEHLNCIVATGRALPEDSTQTAESIAEDNAAYFAGLA